MIYHSIYKEDWSDVEIEGEDVETQEKAESLNYHSMKFDLLHSWSSFCYAKKSINAIRDDCSILTIVVACPSHDLNTAEEVLNFLFDKHV